MDVSEVLDNSSPIDHEPDDLLADDGELAEPALADADPIHLAKCAECASAVRYRPNVTGTGFFLVDDAPDAAFGVGDNGRPVCPNGHGEMEIADDKIPAADAFSEVAAMQQAQQRSLPGLFKPFNFESVFKEIVEQAQRVERLKSEHDAAKEEAASAKKNLDKGAELLMSMTLEFERRRREKPDEAAAAAAAIPACTWSERHAGETCPLCSGETVPIVVHQYLGDASKLAAPSAVAHIDDVEKLLLGQAIDEVVEALENVGTFITAEVIATWTDGERTAATAYANALLDKSANALDVVLPDRPEVLGTPHIPVAAVGGEPQVCQFCEVVLRAADDEDHDPFKVTDYIGTDCRRKPVDAARYPETKASKKKPAAAKAKGAKNK